MRSQTSISTPTICDHNTNAGASVALAVRASNLQSITVAVNRGKPAPYFGAPNVCLLLCGDIECNREHLGQIYRALPPGTEKDLAKEAWLVALRACLIRGAQGGTRSSGIHGHHSVVTPARSIYRTNQILRSFGLKEFDYATDRLVDYSLEIEDAVKGQCERTEAAMRNGRAESALCGKADELTGTAMHRGQLVRLNAAQQLVAGTVRKGTLGRVIHVEPSGYKHRSSKWPNHGLVTVEFDCGTQIGGLDFGDIEAVRS